MQKLSSIMYRGDCTDYILEPVSVQARFIQNNNPVILHSRSSPRFVCDLFVDKFPISLREVSYVCVCVCLSFYITVIAQNAYLMN